MSISHVSLGRFRRCLAIVLLVVPALGNAASASLLDVRDTQSVTRAQFIKAAVTGAEIVPIPSGTLPYDAVPDAYAPYVRAAQSHGALEVFSRDGRKVNFQKTITRGEAVSVLGSLLNVYASKIGSDELRAYIDAKTDADRALISLAVERNWLKPIRATFFGLQRPLKGKEAKLLLTRAFQLQPQSEGTETLSAPVIRVKLQGGGSRLPMPKSEMLEEVWNILRQNYLYMDKLDADTAGDKAVQGLVQSLGDPYTSYMPKTQTDDFQLQMKGEVEGIGATVEMTGSILTIVSPLRGSPAEAAGLKPKDQILSVNGESVQGLSLDDAVRKVRGPKGSEAVLRIRRGSTEFDVRVVRQKVTIPEVEIDYSQNGIAIVKIVQFWDTTDRKFRDAMAEVQAKSPKGIILDLRNNPGGLLHAAGVVVGNFLPKGSTFVSIMERQSTNAEVTEDEPTIKATVPMIVLVNKGSASASEIVAGALQDAKRAQIVGETTYGKGTVQQVVQFTDGSSLKYTVAEWRSPLGRKIDKLGITPDVVVLAQEGKDVQMDRAMELLR